MNADLLPPGARTDAHAGRRAPEASPGERWGGALFADGDPRRAPYAPEELDAAAQAIGDRKRWHVRNRADWLAMQLQFGRGRSSAETGAMFEVGEATVRSRARREGWVQPMIETWLQAMARQVWLTGLARRARGEAVSLSKLRRESEWTPIGPTFSDDETPMHTETNLGDADFRRDHHDAVRRRLDDLIVELGTRLGHAPADACRSDERGDASRAHDGRDGGENLAAVGEV